jgi:hypothetical protein
LREFIRTDPALPNPSRVGAWRRAFATLLTPSRHLATSVVRGGEPRDSAEYRAGPIRVVLGPLAARRRGMFALDGLVLHDAAAPDAVAGREVMLFAADVPVHATRTDDLGNFAFESVAAGGYTLEIHLDAEVVVIENLLLG